MSWKLSARSVSRLVGVDPRLKEVALRALELSTIDFGIPKYGGFRSAQEQRALFDDNKSKCDGSIKLSYHQSGNAMDFYAYVNGRASWDEGHLTTVAAALLQAASELGHKVQWGGHWKGWKDMPHLQLMT